MDSSLSSPDNVTHAVTTHNLRGRLSHAVAVTLALIGLLFLIGPVIVLCVRAISGRGWESAPTTGVPEAVLLSLGTTAITSAVTLVFGTPLAYWLARSKFRWRKAINILVELPIVLPPAVAGLALLTTLGRRGALGGLLDDIGITLPFTTAAVVLAQTFVSAPFFIRAAQLGFSSVPRELEDAARVDGAESWALFRRIMLPIAGRALTAGLVLSWARALGEFGATILFAGSLQGRTQTLPLLIYNVLERDVNAALWTGLILVVLALIALITTQILQRDHHHTE